MGENTMAKKVPVPESCVKCAKPFLPDQHRVVASGTYQLCLGCVKEILVKRDPSFGDVSIFSLYMDTRRSLPVRLQRRYPISIGWNYSWGPIPAEYKMERPVDKVAPKPMKVTRPSPKKSTKAKSDGNRAVKATRRPPRSTGN